MTRARHPFDIADWSDYVRSTIAPDQRNRMQAHLDSGCSQCRELEALLSRFARLTAADAAFVVPEHVERTVRAWFGINSRPQASAFQRILGTLIYDSINDPLPAGVRSGHQISRQMLFRAGDYSLDLRLEHEQGSAKMVLVGQITDPNSAGDTLSRLPVIVASGARELARSSSNSFGEFQIEYEPEPELRLLIPLDARSQQIEIPLGK